MASRTETDNHNGDRSRADKGGHHNALNNSNMGRYKQPSGRISSMCAAGKHEPKCISLQCSCECHDI